MTTLPRAQPPAFSIAVRHQDPVLTVVLTGNADMRAREPLHALLISLHEEACRIAAKEVVIDFRAVDFMNSSCLKEFVGWLTQVQESGPERFYKICFLSAAVMSWQRRSLQALRWFAMDAIRIEA